MATKIVGGWRNKARQLKNECKPCKGELDCFLIQLKALRNLNKDLLTAVGYPIEKLPAIVDGISLRRRYRVLLEPCGGSVTFHWKKQVIDHMTILCPSHSHHG
jgi:hypothetical protein